MTTEQIQRSEATATRAANTMTKLTADEGKKLLNQDYIDGIVEEPTICSCVYLAVSASALDWAEITDEEADKIQAEWDAKCQAQMEADLSAAASDTTQSGEDKNI